ncbi:MAG: right-handed parallel beta-helix repeat-containing protein, partial [Candidatus Limnocylindrales bacterium]
LEAGGTVNASGCLFHERVTIAKALTLNGGTIDGTGLGVPLQQGALTLAGGNIAVNHVRVTGSAGAGVQVTGSSVTIADSEFDHNIQEGFAVSGATNVTFLRDHIDYNNVALTVDPGWEAGGGKAHGTNIVFDGCESDHNGGPGIWFDQWYPSGTAAGVKVYNPGATVRNSRVHDNIGAGIMYEVSSGGKFYNNVVWGNGSPSAGWVWAAGILISSSQNAEVYGNIVAWNRDGISVVSQSRADAPGSVSGNYVHDNTIVLGPPVATDGSDKTLLAFADDWSSGMYAAGANNHGARNVFWSSQPEPQWARFGYWNGTSLQTLAALNGTGAGGASSYATTAQVNAILAGAGLSLAP